MIRLTTVPTAFEIQGGAPRTLAAGDRPVPPVDPYRRRLLAFVGICRSFGIEPVLMTQPLAGYTTELTPPWANPPAQEVFNGVIRDVASREGVVVIDLVRFLEDKIEGWDKPNVVFYDAMHVTDAGSILYAEHIADRLYESVLVRRIRKGAGKT